MERKEKGLCGEVRNKPSFLQISAMALQGNAIENQAVINS